MGKGVLYGVGVGPGDPELLTLKAIRIIKENDNIIIPGKSKEESAAYNIVIQVIPEIKDKTICCASMPMIRDKVELANTHKNTAENIARMLNEGQNAVFLTLGDPGIYSTFSYVRDILIKDGYDVCTIPGVMSISAVAARLNISLADWDEEVHIIPTGQKVKFELEDEGTYVFMKPKGDISAFREAILASKRHVYAVSDCGKENEKVYKDIDSIPDETGYMTVFIVK